MIDRPQARRGRAVTLILALGLTAAGCGGDSVLSPQAADTTSTSSAPDEAPPDEGTTTTAASPTSVEPTTTVLPATTTTSTTTATTAPPTTTTSTTTTTTTTLPLAPPPLPLQFLSDGLGISAFGDAPADAIHAVETYLGMAPTFDSGWGPAWGDYGACPGTEYRQVRFQGLILQFTDAGFFAPEGNRQFFSWAYDGSPPGIAFWPPDIGTSVAELQALYPTLQIYGGDPIFGDTFRVEGPGPHDQLWGTLTGTGDTDTVEYLVGGWGCGE